MPIAYRTLLDLVKAAVTGLPTTGTNVYESPAVPLAANTFPSLVVQVAEDALLELFETPDDDDHLERRQVVPEVTVLATTIAKRDTATLEVAEAVLKTAKPGWARRLRRIGFEESDDGDRLIYAARLRFELDYHVEQTAPDAIVT